MKIDRVRLTQLEGILEHPEPFWEERLVRPVDIYPEDKAEGARWTPMGGPASIESRQSSSKSTLMKGQLGWPDQSRRIRASLSATSSSRSWLAKVPGRPSASGTGYSVLRCMVGAARR
jgi:hypothetical protein